MRVRIAFILLFVVTAVGCESKKAILSKEEVRETITLMKRMLADAKRANDPIDQGCRGPALSSGIDFIQDPRGVSLGVPKGLYALFAVTPDGHGNFEVAWLEKGFIASGFRFEGNGVVREVRASLTEKELMSPTAFRRWSCAVIPAAAGNGDAKVVANGGFLSMRLPAEMFAGQVKVSILYGNESTLAMDACIEQGYLEKFRSRAATQPIGAQ